MEAFNSLLDEALESWQWVRESLIDEVENIPADKFDFSPSPGARTVAEVIRHILEVALMMVGELCRNDTNFHREPWPQLLKRYASHVNDAKTKRELISLLKSSHREGELKFREQGEIFMLQLIKRFDGKPGTRFAWLYHGIGHEMYHTGQLTAYVRALGKVPALTQKIEG